MRYAGCTSFKGFLPDWNPASAMMVIYRTTTTAKGILLIPDYLIAHLDRKIQNLIWNAFESPLRNSQWRFRNAPPKVLQLSLSSFLPLRKPDQKQIKGDFILIGPKNNNKNLINSHQTNRLHSQFFSSVFCNLWMTVLHLILLVRIHLLFLFELQMKKKTKVSYMIHLCLE